MSDHPGHAITACENCATVLQGHYCHVCGQSIANPIRHVGHAFEEAVELFWHLDGRIWRTLRDLISPGRVAVDYLAGHRARYVAPLRLFLVLSLVTFFFARFTLHFTVHIDEAGIVGNLDAALAHASSVAEVQRLRDERIRDTFVVPGARLDALVARINGAAQKRAQELQPGVQLTPPPASPTTPGTIAQDEKLPDPSAIAPDFARDWSSRQVEHVRENVARVQKDPDLLQRAFLGTIPSVLFVLMPVFAFLLKVAYARQKHLYLEHLVVALYSHAYLLLVLLAACLLTALGTSVAWLEVPADWAQSALWLWVPIYLWLMQKRVYRQSSLVTTLKFVQMGVVYMLLIGCGSLLAFLIGMAKL